VVSKTFSQYRITCSFTAVRQDVKSTDNLVVVQELEFAINLALYGVLCILGSQYIVGTLSCFGATLILNFVICRVCAVTISLSEEEVSV
jgi:hypothetical protein